MERPEVKVKLSLSYLVGEHLESLSPAEAVRQTADLIEQARALMAELSLARRDQMNLLLSELRGSGLSVAESELAIAEAAGTTVATVRRVLRRNSHGRGIRE